jgi:DNA-binding CsgD family transcriptional regulator
MLDTSPENVRDHLKIVFAKIGAANRAEAVSIALRKHLLDA